MDDVQVKGACRGARVEETLAPVEAPPAEARESALGAPVEPLAEGLRAFEDRRAGMAR
jgi:hypothetical protein